MNKRNIYIMLFVMVAPCWLSAQKKTSKRPTVAYIEQTRVLHSIQGYEESLREIDSLRTMYSLEVKESVEKLQNKINILLEPYQFKQAETIEDMKSKLKGNDIQLFEMYMQESDFITKATKNYELMLQTIYNQKIKPINDKVNKVIEDFAQSQNLSIIYNVESLSTTVYINQEINITNQIIKLLNY